MLYRHFCQQKIQSLYDLKFYFLFCQDYIQQTEVHQFLIYRERVFLQCLNGVLNLGLCSQILCYEKNRNCKRRTLFLYFFLCYKHFSQKISITNGQHLFLVSSHVFNSSVAFDVNFLRSFLFIPSKISRKLSLQFLEEMLLRELIRYQLCQIWLVH